MKWQEQVFSLIVSAKRNSLLVPRQALNHFPILRIKGHQRLPLRHLKIFKIESRSYRAADQRKSLSIAYA